MMISPCHYTRDANSHRLIEATKERVLQGHSQARCYQYRERKSCSQQQLPWEHQSRFAEGGSASFMPIHWERSNHCKHNDNSNHASADAGVNRGESATDIGDD